MTISNIFKTTVFILFISACNQPQNQETNVDQWKKTFEELKDKAGKIGKPEWRPMLIYVANLHEIATNPAIPPMKYPYEEIGPGYFNRAFGHWDIVHQILDVVDAEPIHAYHQIMNNLTFQLDNGFLPGTIYFNKGFPEYNKGKQGHPPVWPVAVEEYCRVTGNDSLKKVCLNALIQQIDWFEKNRKANDGGYYYTDISHRTYESGIDRGIRFRHDIRGKLSCVDATSHVYQLYAIAADWAVSSGEESSFFQEKADSIKEYIQTGLWDEDSGFFYDSWAIDTSHRHSAFEGMWPVVVGAATPDQAKRVIQEHLLNPDIFFTQHPIASVGINDSLFRMRLWEGPSWNSMNLWAVKGCIRYGHTKEAMQIIEKALDNTAKQFNRSGTIWEYYHPFGDWPEKMERKKEYGCTTPCPDYLGHNPVIAMARLWEKHKIEK